MWLSEKDERRLLQGLYLIIGQVNREWVLTMRDCIPIIKSVLVKRAARKLGTTNLCPSSTNPPTPQNMCLQIEEVGEDERRIRAALSMLVARNLVIAPYNLDNVSLCLTISLTQEAYDLGSKYNSLPKRIGQWFDGSDGLCARFLRFAVKIISKCLPFGGR